jgi:hypothetical protein
MSTIVLRSVKGTPLTNTEVDNNFNNLNTDKVEKAAAAITGGTINNTSVGATTPASGAFTTIAASGTTTLSGNQIISVTDNTNAALRITQLGTGNALLVEDNSNPDATPFVIDSNGQIFVGSTTGYTFSTSTKSSLQVNGLSNSGSSIALSRWQAGVNPSILVLAKSRSGTVGTQGIVSSGDSIGLVTFDGDDGTAFIPAATITAAVDGTPGTNDMPGRLIFSTTADGASTPTERVRITSAGKTGFATDAPAATVHVAGNTILSNVNVLGASYDSVSFSVAGQETSVAGLFFSPNGLKMYVVGSGSDSVNEYNLSTAWVVSSAVFATSFNVNAQDGAATSVFFRADGTKMYVLGSTNDAAYQYTLSSPWSVATATYDSVSFSVTGQDTGPGGFWFKPNGLSMYVIGNTGDTVYQYTLSTAWNVSTATFLQSFSVSGQETVPNGITFTGDGSRMFVIGATGDDVNVYNLTTPWDISTAGLVGVFSVSGQDTAPGDLYIKPDGTKMYVLGNTNDVVYQYTVPSIDIQLTGPASVAALDVQQDLTVYGNTTGSFLNNGFKENISGQYYNLVSQADIGSAPNEIPLNQYLGEMAYMNSDQVIINPVASATPVGIGDMVFQLTNDTTLVVKVKGSDGTVRSATLTLA